MQNENSAVPEVRQKRKYTRRNRVTTGNSGACGSVRLHGIQLQIDPDCMEQLKAQQITAREKEFQQIVLAKFENHISELKSEIQETGDVPESLELPVSIGTASADFSNTPTTDRVLVPGNDYAIRVHVGLMSLMQWATQQIAAMQKEIQDLKSVTVDITTPIPVSVAEVKPTIAPTDKIATGQADPSEMFFTT